jgi:hypothetical protein
MEEKEHGMQADTSAISEGRIFNLIDTVRRQMNSGEEASSTWSTTTDEIKRGLGVVKDIS